MNYLPDISAWLALIHEAHVHHHIATDWFQSVAMHQSVYFCRVSQMGLLRLLTQAQVLGTAVQTQREAWKTYAVLESDPRVSFLPEPARFVTAFESFSSRNEVCPKPWTDDYLAAFASQAGLALVTLDHALAARLPSSVLLTP